MAKAERTKKSTITNNVATMVSANIAIEPTIDLNENELKHFQRVVNSRETSTWSENDRTIACFLAKTYEAMAKLWAEVEEEGYTTVNERGTPVANPSTTALNNFTGQARSLNSVLGISASQKGVSGKAQASRNTAEIEAREIIKKTSKSRLLA